MDETLKLAFNMSKNPGVYALLLGAGISLSAGVPTAWNVFEDLKRQVEQLGGTVNEDMGYDDLLKALGKERAERSAIIRGYFEPISEDIEAGIKVPSAAHHAIAALVRDGYVRLIFTTNFDHLLETALQSINITPEVISSDDMIEGARPARHSAVTIVKLHGDYLDTRTLNTSEELISYSSLKNSFLDGLLPEYGLIICGWSATWDGALRDAIYRVKQTWYSTYWVEPHQLSDIAKNLAQHRKAEIIQSSADTFFVDLQGKLDALKRLNQPHPLSIVVAVERVKKLLPSTSSQIELEDLLRDSARAAYEQATQRVSIPRELNNRDQYDQQVKYYYDQCDTRFASIELFLNMVVTLCWYGSGEQAELLSTLIKWYATAHEPLGHHPHKIPALLIIYAGGIAALARSKWVYLSALLTQPMLPTGGREEVPILAEISKHDCFAYHHLYRPYEHDPVSSFLSSKLFPLFQRYFLEQADFNAAFNLFEMVMCVLALRYADRKILHDAVLAYGGRTWENIKKFWRKGRQYGEDWEFLTTFFDGDAAILRETLRKYKEYADNQSRLTTPDYFAETGLPPNRSIEI